MKNVILMHLESLNTLNFKMNDELFPFLHRFERQCKRYNKYYSTATSTLMVLSDILYGDMRQYESCKSLSDTPVKYIKTESLFDKLKKDGFVTDVLIYPESGDVKSSENRHFLGFETKATIIKDFDCFIDAIDKHLDNEKFALLICPTISNIAINKYIDVSKKNKNETLWELGYKRIDEITKIVVEKLKEKNKLDNTIIVFYGEHGDDYWGHGLHGGLTHAIEPNNLLIKTPLFIWDGEKKENVDNTLVQSTDIYSIVNAIINDNSPLIERKYIFSRNEYAAQEIRKDNFNKAYSVCDGRYMLIVSSNGLEMYDTMMDEACTNNILSFFTYSNKILKFKYQDESRFHLDFFFDAREQRIIRNKFYELLNVLEERVCELYECAGLSKNEMYNEMKFGL